MTESQPTPQTSDEVVDRLVKKYQAQKLWNMVRDELGYSVDCCDEIVDVVTDWLKTHHREETKYDADYNAGWMDCIETLEKDAR